MSVNELLFDFAPVAPVNFSISYDGILGIKILIAQRLRRDESYFGINDRKIRIQSGISDKTVFLQNVNKRAKLVGSAIDCQDGINRQYSRLNSSIIHNAK